MNICHMVSKTVTSWVGVVRTTYIVGGGRGGGEIFILFIGFQDKLNNGT